MEIAVLINLTGDFCFNFSPSMQISSSSTWHLPPKGRRDLITQRWHFTLSIGGHYYSSCYYYNAVVGQLRKILRTAKLERKRRPTRDLFSSPRWCL